MGVQNAVSVKSLCLCVCNVHSCEIPNVATLNTVHQCHHACFVTVTLRDVTECHNRLLSQQWLGVFTSLLCIGLPQRMVSLWSENLFLNEKTFSKSFTSPFVDSISVCAHSKRDNNCHLVRFVIGPDHTILKLTSNPQETNGRATHQLTTTFSFIGQEKYGIAPVHLLLKRTLARGI